MKQSGTKTWRFGCVHCVIFGYYGFETALLNRLGMLYVLINFLNIFLAFYRDVWEEGSAIRAGGKKFQLPGILSATNQSINQINKHLR